MGNQENKSIIKKLGIWFGNIANIVALFAIGIIITNIIKGDDRLVLFSAFGILILIVFLRYADVARFKEAASQKEGVPPLGLAKGSVRALLALGIFLGFGIYIYNVVTGAVEIDDKIFTAIITILSAVVGFYFGSRSTTAMAQPSSKLSAPTISGIEPKVGNAGSKVRITNLAGTGFQSEATVMLVMNAEKILAQDVNVVQSTKITCSFDLTKSNKGKYDVVVTNPDNQTGILPEGFDIILKKGGGG